MERKKQAGFTIKVHSKKKEFLGLREKWNELVLESGADIFQTHEWQYTWWKIFGGNSKLHIITLWKNEVLVAILPFFVEEKKCLGINLSRCIKLIGSRVYDPPGGSLPVSLSFGSYLDIIVHPGYKSAHSEIVRILTDLTSDFDEFYFDELPKNSLLVHIVSLLPSHPDLNIKNQKASTCYQVLISNSWEGYLKTLSRSARKKARQALRNLYDRKEFTLIEANSTQEFELGFNKLVSLHQNRWNKIGKPGIFADKRILKFYKSMSLELFKKGRSKIIWTEAEEEIFAVELEFRFNSIIYAVQGGLDVDSYYSKFSPNKVLLYHSLKEGWENGYATYDWLRGKEEYKSSSSNYILENRTLLIQRKSPLFKLRYTISDFIESSKIKLKNEQLIFNLYLSHEKGMKGYFNYFSNVVIKFKSKLTS